MAPIFPIVWQGQGTEEIGIDASTPPRYFRPTEVSEFIGDASKAAERLGWRHTTSFKELVAEMVQSDLKTIPRELWRKDPGHY